MRDQDQFDLKERLKSKVHTTLYDAELSFPNQSTKIFMIN